MNNDPVTSPSSQMDGSSVGYLQRLEVMAQTDLKAMAQCVQEMARSHTVEKAAKIAGQVVNGVGRILDYVGAIAHVHPVAGNVVEAVQKVVKLEQQRHENHVQIAEVHGIMVSTVYHLKVLVPITDREAEGKDGLEAHLGQTFEHLEKTIKEFGQFVDLYHRCWQKIFKVLMSSHHKQKLDNFSVRFDKHRQEIHRVVATRSTAMTLDRLDIVVANTQRIIHSLPTLDRDMEQVERFVESKGGPASVIENDDLLEQVAEMLGERVTDSMKTTLREDFDELLERHAERYELKLQSLENNIITTMNASHAELSRQFNAGPHEVIEDKDMQEIWKNNGWKSGVKCRTLVEAMHEHYQRKFIEHRATIPNVRHHDEWTVDFFSRMMYHSAIGDIVDEDGSGFITASEMNTFCSPAPNGRRPANWSIPEWFAFCASGWYNNNTWYYDCIKKMVKQIDEEIHKDVKRFGSGHDEYRHHIKSIVDSLKPLLLIEDIEDVPEQPPPHQLRRLQEEYRTQEMTRIRTTLEKFSFHLEDKTAVAAIMGDTRIELHIMCILYILIYHLAHIIPNKLRLNAARSHAIEDMAMSIIVAHLAFEERMHELMRGWRSQGRDIELQLGRYADGLFKNIQRDATKRNHALASLCKTLFVHEKVPPRFRSMIESASHSPHTRLEELTELVTSIAARLDRLEGLLRNGTHGVAPPLMNGTAVMPTFPVPFPAPRVGTPGGLPDYASGAQVDIVLQPDPLDSLSQAESKLPRDATGPSQRDPSESATETSRRQTRELVAERTPRHQDVETRQPVPEPESGKAQAKLGRIRRWFLKRRENFTKQMLVFR